MSERFPSVQTQLDLVRCRVIKFNSVIGPGLTKLIVRKSFNYILFYCQFKPLYGYRENSESFSRHNSRFNFRGYSSKTRFDSDNGLKSIGNQTEKKVNVQSLVHGAQRVKYPSQLLIF